jgi:hypothetical protein
MTAGPLLARSTATPYRPVGPSLFHRGAGLRGLAERLQYPGEAVAALNELDKENQRVIFCETYL